MKKTAIFVFALILCLILSSAYALAEDKQYLFLDIPFGIGMEECKVLLEKKAETLFSESSQEHVKPSDKVIYLGNLVTKDPFMFYGYPAQASFYFSSKDQVLEKVVVEFDLAHEMAPDALEDRPAFFRVRAEKHAAVFGELETVFGAIDTGVFSAGDTITSSGNDLKNYRYPVLDGKLDADVLSDAIGRYRYVILRTTHRNVETRCIDCALFSAPLRASAFDVTYNASQPNALELLAMKAVTMSCPEYPMP